MKWNWLSISLFCDTCYWNSVYLDVLSPLIRSKKIVQWYAKCKLFDEHHRLDLYLCVEQSTQEKIVMDMHEQMKGKLASLPATQINQAPPFSNEVLFMPFPINSVQYGLFRVSKIKKNENWLDTVLKSSIKLLIKNQTTYENVITLLFNLYGFIIIQMADGSMEFTRQVLEKIESVDRVNDKKDFKILFNSEKEVFMELLHNIKIGCNLSDAYFLKQNIGIRAQHIIPEWGKKRPMAHRIELTIKYIETISAYLLTSNFIKWTILTAIYESATELQEMELTN